MNLQTTETLRDIKELVQGCRALRQSACFLAWDLVNAAVPWGREGRWGGEGEAFSGENNARKEAGK